MKKLAIIGAALVLAIPPSTYAAVDSCEDMKQGAGRASHDVSAAPAT